MIDLKRKPCEQCGWAGCSLCGEWKTHEESAGAIRRDEHGRALCTPERPWMPADGTPVAHMNAHEVGEQEAGYPGGDIVTMKCKDCGATWRAELPQ